MGLSLPLLRHMEETGTTVMVPRRDPDVAEEPFLDFTPNYVLRAIERFPRQGDRAPWRLRMNFFVDRKNLRNASIHDDVMEFSRHRPREPERVEAAG